MVFLNEKASTKLTPLPLLQTWIKFNWLFHLLLSLNGTYIILLSKVHSYIAISLKRFAWRSPMSLIKMVDLSFIWRNCCTIWKKPLRHAWYGMIDQFLNLGFKCCELDHNIYKFKYKLWHFNYCSISWWHSHVKK